MTERFTNIENKMTKSIQEKCEEFLKESQKSGYSIKDSLYFLFRMFCTTTFGSVDDFKDFINFYTEKHREVNRVL